jgi:hypothetical protein
MLIKTEIIINPELIKKAEVERIWNNIRDDNKNAEIRIRFKNGVCYRIIQQEDIFYCE